MTRPIKLRWLSLSRGRKDRKGSVSEFQNHVKVGSTFFINYKTGFNISLVISKVEFLFVRQCLQKMTGIVIYIGIFENWIEPGVH